SICCICCWLFLALANRYRKNILNKTSNNPMSKPFIFFISFFVITQRYAKIYFFFVLLCVFSVSLCVTISLIISQRCTKQLRDARKLIFSLRCFVFPLCLFV